MENKPVLVEATLDVLVKEVGPGGGEGTETTGSLDVSNDTDGNHGRGLEDGDSLNDLLVVELGSNTDDLADDVGHTGLVSNEGGEVRGNILAVTGEGSNATTVGSTALAGKESQGSVSGGFLGERKTTEAWVSKGVWMMEAEEDAADTIPSNFR